MFSPRAPPPSPCWTSRRGRHAGKSETHPRQQQVLDLVQSAIERTGARRRGPRSPPELGFRSANAAEEHLQALARKGRHRTGGRHLAGIRLQSDTLRALHQMRNRQFSLPLPGIAQLTLPLIGRVAAGSPILAQEHIDQTYLLEASMFPRRPDYLLKVRGMSMRDAGILDGDLLAVQKTHEARAARSSLPARRRGHRQAPAAQRAAHRTAAGEPGLRADRRLRRPPRVRDRRPRRRPDPQQHDAVATWRTKARTAAECKALEELPTSDRRSPRTCARSASAIRVTSPRATLRALPGLVRAYRPAPGPVRARHLHGGHRFHAGRCRRALVALHGAAQAALRHGLTAPRCTMPANWLAKTALIPAWPSRMAGRLHPRASARSGASIVAPMLIEILHRLRRRSPCRNVAPRTEVCPPALQLRTATLGPGWRAGLREWLSTSWQAASRDPADTIGRHGERTARQGP